MQKSLGGMDKSNVQILVAMKGHPGTGKTTLARAVAAALRCPLLDKDDIRDCTLPVERALGGGGGGGGALLNDLSYSVLWRMAESQLRLGLPVLVIDSPLSRRAHLDRLLDAAAIAGARVVVVECRPGDEAEWRRRVEARGGDGGWHKPATWGEMERLMEGYRGCTEYDFGDVQRLVVDTTDPAAEGGGGTAATVVEFIKSHAFAS